MPRWKDLPDEMDPQVREFASQLRRLVDRSGLSIAALADRTGYSKTSWERYLNGRLLAPKGAIVALAEVTGTNPVHLTTMWELAERAWSRSEMRHDMTMEAIRISQARAALSEFGPPPANTKGGTKTGRAARRGGSATAAPGVAGPAGVSPTVPVQPSAPDVPDSSGRPGPSRDAADARDAESSGGNSWGVAGYRGPAPTGAGRAPSAPGASPYPPGAPGEFGAPPQGPRADRRSAAAAGAGKRRVTMFLAGVVGVLVVIGLTFYLTSGGGAKKDDEAVKSPSPSATTSQDLPAGVKCSGDSCTGKDAEAMGCSGDLVTTAKTATVGTAVVEVRYSETCGAAWGRVTQASQGAEVSVEAGENKETGSITATGDTIAYTPMVAVKDAGEAVACATLAAGQDGCTK
ncbi:DUF2690 domain-containing protein [Streptomyces sp. NPDC052302]|uniref:helix-turn-helix domain-containing protein n=1 Tax=Streptomyces sp. NPDC052302 TaxID=3365688 RepID=UPI0037D6A25C